MDFDAESFIKGTVFEVGSGEPVASISGDWRGVVEVWREDDRRDVLLDMTDWSIPREEKVVAPVAEQLDLESRRLWRFLTRALARYTSELDPDTAKREVEDWARNREVVEDDWQPQFFVVDSKNQENVQFKFSLAERNEV